MPVSEDSLPDIPFFSDSLDNNSISSQGGRGRGGRGRARVRGGIFNNHQPRLAENPVRGRVRVRGGGISNSTSVDVHADNPQVRSRGHGRRGVAIQSREVNVNRKRVSELSHSIVGENLRNKRRRVEPQPEPVVSQNSLSQSIPDDVPVVILSNEEPAPVVRRGRGRPRGSKNKNKRVQPEPSFNLRPSTAALVDDSSFDERYLAL